MDRLTTAIEARHNPSVIGLDPAAPLIPQQIVASYGDEAADTADDPAEIGALRLAMAFLAFNTAIIDAVADLVPAVKPQIAMYEALGPRGVDVYAKTCRYAHQHGLYVIGDVKRGDIGSTAAAYAHHLSGVASLRADGEPDVYDPWCQDAVTVNPYLGADGIAPFTAAAKQSDKDIFVLVHTSNPSSAQIQELELHDGGRLYERVSSLVESWGEGSRGDYGYSRVGAVFGATFGEQGAALRDRMPHTMLLVPGYGAQGGTADDIADLFDGDGRGAIINSSRGIIGSWRSSAEYAATLSARDALEVVARSARSAAIQMRDDLRHVAYR